MREFLLNSEEQLDQNAVRFLKEEGQEVGLFPCHWIRFNNRIKVTCFPDGCRSLQEMLPEMNLDQTCAVAKSILRRVRELERCSAISPENIVWDRESVYVDEQGQVHMICLPAVVMEDALHNQIYGKRIYALLQEIIHSKEDGELVCRQIRHTQEMAPEDWDALETALDRRAPKQDEVLVLKSINTPNTLTFYVRHGLFRIGTDPAEVDGWIRGVESVSPVHAEIGWNEINFYVRDLRSENGTFVNNQRITPGVEVPIGEGTVLRFAEYTFNVE